jgi:polyphosphate kinase 2
MNLQTEMVRMQNWAIANKKRVLIIFEGRDSAGKGGAIMRFIRFINPRFYRVIALDKPTDIEKGQWFFQRYIMHLPKPGQMVFFDRSWYNRAVVEPVMGFCSNDQYEMFLKQVVQVEKMLIEDGCQIIKFWFSIDIEEQKNRLEERKINPLIHWKLSTVDMQAQYKWDDYTRYKEAMFKATSTEQSPWIVIKGNDKDRARKEAIRYVLENTPYDKKGLTGERIQPEDQILTVLDGK